MMKNVKKDSQNNDHCFTFYNFKQNDAVSSLKWSSSLICVFNDW
jgi:hypothetical protein